MFRITIFAARRVLPPDLIAPAKESKPFMKESGPEAVPPAERPSCEPRMAREVRAGARAELEEHPLGLGEVEDRVHRVAARVDEAGGGLGLRLDADVEPDGRVEGGDLVDEDRGELVVEGVAVGGGLEVAALLAVARDRAGDALDQLPDGGLALGRADAAVEVLLDDDVRRGLRPGLGDLDVLLLEDRLALLGHDRRRAQLPLDRVVRRDRRVRIDAAESQALEASCRRWSDDASSAARLAWSPFSVLAHPPPPPFLRRNAPPHPSKLKHTPSADENCPSLSVEIEVKSGGSLSQEKYKMLWIGRKKALGIVARRLLLVISCDDMGQARKPVKLTAKSVFEVDGSRLGIGVFNRPLARRRVPQFPQAWEMEACRASRTSRWTRSGSPSSRARRGCPTAWNRIDSLLAAATENVKKAS